MATAAVAVEAEPHTLVETEAAMIQNVPHRRWVCACGAVGRFVRGIEGVMTAGEWARGAHSFHVDNPTLGVDQ